MIEYEDKVNKLNKKLEKFDKLDKKIDNINNNINKKIECIDKKIDKLFAKFNSIESKLDSLSVNNSLFLPNITENLNIENNENNENSENSESNENHAFDNQYFGNSFLNPISFMPIGLKDFSENNNYHRIRNTLWRKNIISHNSDSSYVTTPNINCNYKL